MRAMKFLASLLLSLALLASQVITPAQATILYAGGEDIDGALSGGASVNTTAGSFRSGYARESINVPFCNGCSADPPNAVFVSTVWSSQSTVWLHFEIQYNNSQVNNIEFFGLYGSDGVRRLMIRSNGSLFKLSKRTSAAVFTDLATCTSTLFPANTLSKIDIHVNYAVSGLFDVYGNDVLLCHYSGDVTTDSQTAVNQFELGTAANGSSANWSEMIVSTTDTRDMNLMTCAPQANGTNQSWTGSASSVNPTSITDTTSLTTSSSNQVAEFTCPSLVSGTFTVPAITSNARIQIGSSGPQNFRYIARPAGAGADFDSGTDIAGTSTFQNSGQYIWTVNPNTSAAWATTDLGSGVNFGIKSRP